MYLIEYLNDERDIVLRQSFKNVKEFLEAIYKLPTSLIEVQMNYDARTCYVDASASGTLICRYSSDDIYIALSRKGILKRYEVYENLDHNRAWEKLWVKPESSKISAFLSMSKIDRKLLPQFTAFRVKGKTYSVDDLEGLPSHKFVVLKDAPGKIYMETPSDVIFFANIEDFEPIEVFISFTPLLSVLNYSEVPCLPL